LAQEAGHLRPKRAQRLSAEVRRVLAHAGISSSAINCNSDVYWHQEFRGYAEQAIRGIARSWKMKPSPEQQEAGSAVVVHYLVRTMFQLLKPNNLGAMWLELGKNDVSKRGRRILVFRSAINTDAKDPEGCLQTLIRHGGVRHVINLYSGDMPLDDFLEEERKATRALGATHVSVTGPWRQSIKSSAQYQRNRGRVMQQLAQLIKDRILRPGGKPPRGHVHVHCGGGMHRTGMVYGVLQRCLGRASPQAVRETFQRHTGYRSAREPGGFEALNLKFIEDFDCRLLER
jgi:hypothetical protein